MWKILLKRALFDVKKAWKCVEKGWILSVLIDDILCYAILNQTTYKGF